MDYDRNSQWNLATDEFPATEKVLTDQTTQRLSTGLHLLSRFLIPGPVT